MGLKLHNTLTRLKETFVPIDEEDIRMYVCGPTVYDLAHIGNARPVVVFDVLYRLLKSLYPKVTYVRNITDVDDKINAKAAETGVDIRTLTEGTAEVFHKDMAALNALDPDEEPRATDHIPEMKEMIATLIEKKYAYEKDEHVLFEVSKWDQYGKLSGNTRDEIIAGARVEIAPYKRDPADFVLWKPSSGNEPGWDSDWGFGRPGWHLECSAMSKKYLGEEFDIHGGGQDLIFPHHENEIAQSRCCHGTEAMARLWMHNGYLMTEGEKMSKSLGNFYTVHDLLKEFPGEAIRLALLKTHYRKPLDFTKDGIKEAKKELDGFYRAIQHLSDVESIEHIEPIHEIEVSNTVESALLDDLNTPLAIACVHVLADYALNPESVVHHPTGAPTNVEMGWVKYRLLSQASLLGLLQQDPEQWFKGGDGLDEAVIEDMIAKRTQARANKDFAESDCIRDELAAQGVILEDGAGGTTWRRQ